MGTLIVTVSRAPIMRRSAIILLCGLSGRYLSEDPALENVSTNPAVAAPEKAGGVRDEFGLRLQGLWQTSDVTQTLFNVHYAEDNGINPAPLNDSLDLGRHQISIGPDGVQQTDNEFYGASDQCEA